MLGQIHAQNRIIEAQSLYPVRSIRTAWSVVGGYPLAAACSP